VAITTFLLADYPANKYRQFWSYPYVCSMIEAKSTSHPQATDVALAKVEPVVQPDSIADDVPRESVTLISIHPPILTIGPVKLSMPIAAMFAR
jgi:hypothetical protein